MSLQCRSELERDFERDFRQKKYNGVNVRSSVLQGDLPGPTLATSRVKDTKYIIDYYNIHLPAYCFLGGNAFS